VLAISKYPHEWASYPMIKQVYDDIIDNNTLLVDTTWTQDPAEVQDNIERWLNNDHHTVVIMNWWDDFGGYEKYIAQYQNNDRVLILDYKASWLNICDQKFINYNWNQVQPKSFEHLFLCYQGKWKHNRDAMYSMLDTWNSSHDKKGIVTLAGKNVLTNNIPAHEGDASIDNLNYTDANFYPNDIYSLGDINVWNNHFLNIVSETLSAQPVEKKPMSNEAMDKLILELEQEKFKGKTNTIIKKGKKIVEPVQGDNLNKLNQKIQELQHMKLQDIPDPNRLVWLTEKTLKPIIGSRPFVIYGDEAIYNVLNSFGLETFEDELNFTKVTITNDALPYWHSQTFEIQKGLQQLLETDLNNLYKKCLPKLEHNFHTWRKVAKDQYVSMIDKVSAFKSLSHTS